MVGDTLNFGPFNSIIFEGAATLAAFLKDKCKSSSCFHLLIRSF